MAQPTRHLRATSGFALLSGVTSLSLVFAWIGTDTLALVAAAGVALMVMAPLLALANLGGLRLSGPDELCGFAGLSIPCDLEVRRTGILPARDLLFVVEDGRRLGAPPTGHVARLPPGQGQRVRCQPRFAERGQRSELQVTVESGFPLGLFVARAEFRLPADLLVLPRIVRIGPLARPLRRLAGPAEAAQRGVRGWGDFHALREWRPGESLRGVAWKPSARRGRLLARELVSDDHPALRVVLCTRVEGILPARRHPYFERAVQVTASLLDDLVRRGQRVALSLEGDEPRHFPSLRGRLDLRRALACLAGVEATGGTPRVPRLEGSQIPIVVLVGGGEPRHPEQGLVIDVEVPGWSVREADARAGLRRGQEVGA